MIDSITVWVKSIIFVVLFASFLELLLPNNSMQRFIRVIMGLFIMLAILNPIISVIETRLTEDQIPTLATRAESDLSDGNILSAANHVTGKRNELARELYIRDLSKQIRATVLAIDGVADAKVTVAIADAAQQENVGKIKSVVVYIEPGIIADERKIAKVVIRPDVVETTNKSDKLSQSVIDKVKRAVTELYQLKSNQVEVKRKN
ncbi:stage III sporulation protein AF [Sporomusa malonica]|uniref:Stage III sporulation protein AF n=1 Tax=Sporomusa malonica TaxID=112901 RepID=A0A1W2AED2_9FIRM|nr:stage III sporulation protein AF [Sporomusa malonica]SMC58984.1 stage III sporulation protein AF [Sporomusa malonica]